MSDTQTPARAVNEKTRDEILRLIREEFDPTPPAWEGREWDDNAEDVADKIVAAVLAASSMHAACAWLVLKRWLAEYAEGEAAFSRYKDDVLLDGVMTAKERRALSAALRPEGEAVAYLHTNGSTRVLVDGSRPLDDEDRALGWVETPLFATPPAPAQVEAASLPAPGGVVRVKPLEWRESAPQGWEAEGLFGTSYDIKPPVGNYGFRVMFSWSTRLHDFERPTLDAAKAAAQADYESRIRAALATDASPSGEGRDE